MNTRLYTVDEAISNLVLLEFHFYGLRKDRAWCMDCITKHTYALRGLSQEGVKFFSEDPEPWRKLFSWAVKVLDLGELEPEQGETLAVELSEFRKEVFVPLALAERKRAKSEQIDDPTIPEGAKMTRICGFCGKLIEEGDPGLPATHDICDKCAAQYEEEIADYKRGADACPFCDVQPSEVVKGSLAHFQKSVQVCDAVGPLKDLAAYVSCIQEEVRHGHHSGRDTKGA